MSNILEVIQQLNEKQKEAVLAVSGPVRIIAGAGSGKTRVITSKIAYLIQYARIRPWRICAVTFTNKAANEMKERVINLVGESGKRAVISTYHSLCVRILREDCEALGLPRGFNILDTQDKEQLLRKIYRSLNYNYDAQEGRIVKSRINEWKSDFISPKQALEDAGNDNKQARWALVYQKYEEKLNELKSLDFDDLIIKTYLLFKNNPEILEKWQNKFDYILVDEFQDTNEIQFDLIRWLSKKHQNITVVGDPDQTIYSWRGAKVSLIINFERYFDNVQTIILDCNYRSTQNILSLANNLIVNNANRIEKNLYTENKNGKKITLYHAHNSINEADFVAKQINSLVKDAKDYQFEDILILYRANYLSRDLEESLLHYGISYRIYGAFKFYERKEIKDVLAMLKVFALNDPLSVERVLLLTPRLGEKTMLNILEVLNNNQLTLKDLLINHLSLLTPSMQKNLADLSDAFASAEKLWEDECSIKDLVSCLVEKSGYLQRLKDNFEDDRVENVKELIESIDVFELQQEEDSSAQERLFNYLENISLQTELDNDEVSGDTVSLMTIHNAKGLEKKVVFLIGLNEGIFPSIQAIKAGPDQLEEERRAMYVAITRAKELLYLSYSDGYSYIIENERMPSRFIKELDEELLIVQESDFVLESAPIGNNKSEFRKDMQNKLNNSSSRKFDVSKHKSGEEFLNLRVGDFVEHAIFGKGKVVALYGTNVQVDFLPPFNRKIVSQNSFGLKLVNSN